jgi:hypothetical protein
VGELQDCPYGNRKGIVENKSHPRFVSHSDPASRLNQELEMEDVMTPAPPAVCSSGSANPRSDLSVKHSDELECGLADFGCIPQAKLGVDENRLAVNVVLGPSEARAKARTR